MRVQELSPNPQNPRSVTEAKLKMLGKALREFGDLSGIVFNRKTKRLVSGHQRKKHLAADAPITITKKFSKPTKVGTIAEGFIEHLGERFSYREVFWAEPKEKAATIAANKGAGQWNEQQLAQWLKDLTSFDSDFDIDLTMFDSEELAKLPMPIMVAAHTRTTDQEAQGDESEDEAEQAPPRCREGQVYALGDIRLKCSGDLHYCDLIIDRWEKYAGLPSRLVNETKVRKPKKD